MTLRDWFAGQAISGILIRDRTQFNRELAEFAYDLADAMIEKKGKEPDNVLHSKIRDKLARQIKELRELKEQTRS
jgi:predicted ArsR family transcriptional regulator